MTPTDDIKKLRSFIRAEEKTLGEVVLGHDRQFIVPLNQRPWAWKDGKDVQFLLDDFSKAMVSHFDPNSNPKWKRRKSINCPPHFLGTFVFFQKTKTQYEIFDGQQRMTAIIMLCSVLREIAHTLTTKAGMPKSEANNTYGGFNQWLRLSPTTSEPRIQPNSLFRDLFEALIFNSVDEKMREKALQELPHQIRDHAVSKKLVSSFNHIYAWVHEQTDACTPEEAIGFLTAAHDVLREFFACTETIILDEQYAYEVFQCLNARGENLTAADNIKNELFKESNKPVHGDISNKWNEIGENVPNQDVGEFLRRRHIALISPCKKKDTYEQIKSKEIRDKGVKRVIDEWHQDSRLTKKSSAGRPI